MKIKHFLTVFILSLAVTFSTNAGTTTNGGNETPKEVRAHQIENRLVEIKKIAKENTLSSAEKKDLRKEVKSLKKEARTNGIYLSIGAIIIIILLLILILK